jgi:ABC-type oligopeptide transport system substrate-binding subunit/class 3 adenylate cyclase
MGAMAMREERKVVTALFADLVGSTALGERLDPEDVKVVVGEAVARIVHAVEDFGGTVKDLAGDGVLALFGAPTAHEDDPERAVRSGLKIVADLGAYAREVAQAWGVDGFGVRVGVDTGPVALGPVGSGARVEYAAFGDTVNTAARLQAAAEPGTVLVGAATHRVTEPLFEWGPGREVSLKGKASPVLAHSAVRPLAMAGKVRGLAGVQTSLVGRDRELAVAGDAMRDVLAGRGGILLITGEAGIGKSRLVVEARDVFEESETGGLTPRWLEGRCVSYGEALPYWPFRDLVRDWLGSGPDDPELRVRVALLRALDPLFGERSAEIYPYLGTMLGLSLEPEAAERLQELSPEALQYRTFEVVGTVLQRLAQDGPVVACIDDLHWADPTSVQLVQRLLPLTEEAAVLLVLVTRPERDHGSWQIREVASRELPHRTRELDLEALSGRADQELLAGLVGTNTLPESVERRLLTHAEGNPFYLEELVRSLVDSGALVRDGEGWRFDHEVAVEVPDTVEKVILARLDRLEPATRDVLTAASVLGRRFGLPLLEGVAGEDGEIRGRLRDLERLDLVHEARRWPQPEYRFKHALIQEAAYRTILVQDRRRLHRKAAEWMERRQAVGDEVALGVLAHHWLAAADEDKAIAYLTKAGDRARQEYALDEAIGHYRELLPLLEERGERDAVALVLFKLALALHTSLRFAEANDTYQRAFGFWRPPAPCVGTSSATLRVATSFLPNDPDPKSAIAWPNIQLCMQLFDRLVEQWPERTIVPSLAEWWEIAPDGLRYTFRLRDGLRWSDGMPLTAHDVEFGIKRVLNPDSPGSSVAIYFVLEEGQDYYLRHHKDPDRIGVRALDDRTVEFRLAAPAPYFMSVMNRPDGGPQPRHAIEALGGAWTEPGRQVVSGPYRLIERSSDGLVLERRSEYTGRRPGNVARVEMVHHSVADALAPYERGEFDVIGLRYTPRLADLMTDPGLEATMGLAGWSLYLAFDHRDAAMGNLHVRKALAHAIDRDALDRVAPSNLAVARGGVVPPSLQGHTPDIALPYDPELARRHLGESGYDGPIAMAALDDWGDLIAVVADGWRRTLEREVVVRTWSVDQALRGLDTRRLAPIVWAGWLPGYPDPEYYLRLLLHSDSLTNEGAFAHPPFDELIERARQERSDRARLELFHQADRMAVAERVALIPIGYGRSMAFVQPWVSGWWEFGKTSSSFADLVVDPSSPRANG